MIQVQEVRAALRWLEDLPGAPAAASAAPWLERLSAELERVSATGPALLDACQRIARRAGQWHPTPGQIAEEVQAVRMSQADARQATAWRDPAPASRQLPGSLDAAVYPPEGWTRGRDMGEVAAAIQDLVRRGHRGADSGEGYVVAVLREERERDEARARGERYRPPVYGPSPGPASLHRRGGVHLGE